ncbi:MAG: EAL domain-containing protein, partial [Clostridiales bacterium]|nr:EAL domain-containing protein [Clostridiales bacterium]
EEKLSDVFRLLDGETDDQEIASHTGSSNFALLLKYEDKDSLEKRLWDIIEKLGKTDDHHHFNFHAGVVLLEDAASGKKFKLSNVDLDREYNNACNARIAGEDNDDSSVYFFDEKLVEDQKWIDSVHESQEKAVENEEFKVYYQPKYDPRTDELRGAEALIRWISPEFGFVPPGKFIPIFEQNGFITEIDHYMLRHVAKDQKKWLDEGYECVPVSVNISRAHFIENDLADQIRKIVENEGCPTSLIEIELTESAFFDDKKAMLNTISKLQSFGFAVSMDDFGSGYSSLNSLKDLPLDVLKLDSGFFRDISTDGRGEIVVSEAIRLAKNLNMKIVAEGVEVKEQVDFLASEGCDMIQGYYYAKPMPGEEYLEKMVRNGIPEREEPTLGERDADENEQNSPEAE